MVHANKIAVSSINNANINNSYFKQADGSETLVAIFPGRGYTCDMPVLYYCREAALQAGCDVMNLTYFYQCTDMKHDNDDDNDKQVINDCCHSINRCISQANKYRRIIFVSKSIGTVYSGETALLLDGMETKHFFITPLAKTIPYIEKSNCSVIVGDQDPFFSEDNIQMIKKLPFTAVHVLKGADHSLEVPENCLDSIKTLTTATKLWINFLARYSIFR